MTPLVIFHGGCKDGFCAAWVAHGAMPDAELFAGFYGQPPPDVTGRDVYVVDFSYPRGVMDGLRERAKSLTVLDHHKTAEAALAGFGADDPSVHVTFDMQRSGAGIAWDHLRGGVRPWIVDYVEDRDLWRKALPESDTINAWISTIPFDFKAWDNAHADMAQDSVETGDHLRGARIQGKAVEAKIANYIAEVRKNARRFDFEGFNVPLVNAPQVDISELVHALTDGEAFAMGWWQDSRGIFNYSLRSVGDFDVSELAKRHGGGGHKNAAGFQLKAMLP